MPTISVILSDQDFATLQKALLHTDGQMGDTSDTFTEAVVKTKVQEYFKDKVETYDKAKNTSINYSSFSPS